VTSYSFATIAAIVIFLATYVVIAAGRLPGFRLDRAGAALIGASLMVAVRRAHHGGGLQGDRSRQPSCCCSA